MSTRYPNRRSALFALGALPLLASCSGSETERTAGNPRYATIDQSGAIAHGPVAGRLPRTPTIDEIRQRGYLRQSGSLTNPGFALENVKTGAVTGFDAGIAQLLAKYLLGKPEVDTVTGGSDTREAMLGNHSVDVAIGTYTIKENRARLVNFAGPYYVAHSGVLVAADNRDIRRLSDLDGRRVAVQPGAAEESLRKEVPHAIPVLFEQSSQNASAVRQGRVVAWSANTALLLGKSVIDKELRMTDIAFGSSPFGIGTPKDDPAFKSVVVEFLHRIMADGTWRKLWECTVGVLTPGPVPHPPRVGSVPGS